MGLLEVKGLGLKLYSLGRERAFRCDMALVLAADDDLEAYSGPEPQTPNPKP